MTTALQNAQQQARELADKLGLVRDNGGAALREYTVRYRLVEFVDGQGDACEHCQAATVYANTYLRTLDGDEITFHSCRLCVFQAIDGTYDTDPSYIVTVETPQ